MMQRRLTKEESTLLLMVVAAGLASRSHARRVIETNQTAVIAAWRRELAELGRQVEQQQHAAAMVAAK